MLLFPIIITLLNFFFNTIQAQCPDIFPSVTDKIINGNPTLPSYHISLSSPPTPAVRRCTASRISQRWALTAAHCQVTTSWTARLQASNITDGTPAQILQVFNHPGYKHPTDRRFDITLLKLDAAPVSNRNTLLLNFDSSLPHPHSFVRVAGYGANQTTSAPTHGLLTHVDIPIVSFPKCQQLYQGTPNVGLLQSDKQLCAGYLSGGCDACSGDSGGPIVQFDTAGRAVLVALVSASRGCALPNFPGIAVRIDAYLPWLTKLGAIFQTGVGVQVLASPNNADHVSQSPSPSQHPDIVPVTSSPSTTDTQPLPTTLSSSPSPRHPAGRPGRRPSTLPDPSQGATFDQGKPNSPPLPPLITPSPSANQLLDDDDDDEELVPTYEADDQKSEALASDVSVGGGIEGGGISGGIVAGAVIGALALIAMFVVSVVFVLKKRNAGTGLVEAEQTDDVEPAGIVEAAQG